MIAAQSTREGHRTAVAAVFDAQASRYDQIWTDSAVGRLQRDSVWREIDRLFRPGQRLLDLGCGTGTDAIHFARSGISVCAVDISPEMLLVGRSRVDSQGLDKLVKFRKCPLEGLADLESETPFDGAISNFGALNCVSDLQHISPSLGALLRPGTFLAVCYMGRFCLWETIWYLLHGRPAKAFRRVRGSGTAVSGGAGAFRVYYPSVSNVVSALKGNFRLVSFRSVGVLIPPSYMERFVNLFPRIFGSLAFVDDWIGSWPLLRALGDHRLLIFVRE